MHSVKRIIDSNRHQIRSACNALNIDFYCSSQGIKQTRKNTLRRHRKAGRDVGTIKESMHKSFNDIDGHIAGLLCPLERKRNTLAFVATVAEHYLQNPNASMTFATTILPQHSIKWRDFEKIPTQASTVRRKLEDTIREYNLYEEADARSFGCIEMGAGFDNDDNIVITPHVHAILINAHVGKFRNYFHNRKSAKGIKGAKPLKCVEIPTDRDLIRVAHYITKFQYFMSVPRFDEEGLRRIFNSNETMPLSMRIPIDEWMSKQEPQDLFSFVNVPRFQTNWFYWAEMDSIISYYLEYVKEIVGESFDW